MSAAWWGARPWRGGAGWPRGRAGTSVMVGGDLHPGRGVASATGPGGRGRAGMTPAPPVGVGP